jgi:hypothetical protein
MCRDRYACRVLRSTKIEHCSDNDSLPQSTVCSFNALCIQLKNTLTGTVVHMIEMVRSNISDLLYRLHDIPIVAERLVAINVFLKYNTFAVRDSDRDLADGVGGSYYSWRVRTVLSGLPVS